MQTNRPILVLACRKYRCHPLNILLFKSVLLPRRCQPLPHRQLHKTVHLKLVPFMARDYEAVVLSIATSSSNPASPSSHTSPSDSPSVTLLADLVSAVSRLLAFSRPGGLCQPFNGPARDPLSIKEAHKSEQVRGGRSLGPDMVERSMPSRKNRSRCAAVPSWVPQPPYSRSLVFSRSRLLSNSPKYFFERAPWRSACIAGCGSG